MFGSRKWFSLISVLVQVYAGPSLSYFLMAGGFEPRTPKTKRLPSCHATLFSHCVYLLCLICVFSLLGYCFNYTRIGPPQWWTINPWKKHLNPPTTLPYLHFKSVNLTYTPCHNCAVFKHKPVEQNQKCFFCLIKLSLNQSFPPTNYSTWELTVEVEWLNPVVLLPVLSVANVI